MAEPTLSLDEQFQVALREHNENPRDAAREQRVNNLLAQIHPTPKPVDLDGGVIIGGAPPEQQDNAVTEENAQRAAAEFQVALANDPEFGMAFDDNLAAAQRAHQEFFGDRAAEIAERVDAMLSESEKIAAVKLLAKLARR